MKLFPHQEEALKQTEGFSNIAFFHDMGLGKTFTGSEAMFRFNTKTNLIICQKSKVQDWVDHLGQNYKDDHICAFDLTDSKSFKEFFRPMYTWYDRKVGVINYELAWRRKDLLDLEDFILMLDESSLIQNPTAKQSRFVLKLKPSHVILLSGTPVGGKYENLWTQSHLLGWKIKQKAFQETYVNWINIEAGGMIHRIVNKTDPYKNTDRMKRKLADHGAVFLKTEEVMDLPEQNFCKIKVDPVPEYKKFMEERIVVVEGQELVGDTTLTKLLYARQLSGQYNKNKLNAFEDLIRSTQDRLIVFYNFNEELIRLKTICQINGRPTSEINGHRKDLTAYEEESNSITLCQYQSASKGLNLQKCNKIIYFTLPLSSEHFEQSKKRIHRIGQNQSCHYYLMICRGSVEEQILKTLEQRKDFTDDLFRKGCENDQMQICSGKTS